MDGGDRVGHELRLRAAVLAGDERAWQAWYDASADGLRAYVHWRCAGLHDMADEVVQETWLTAVRRVRGFDPRQGPFAGWLCGIAANLLRNRLRRRIRHSGRVRALAGDCPAPGARDERERSERIACALAELAPRHEQVLRAKYLDEQSVQAIADAWGESPKAIESLLTRARQAFREAYQRTDPDDGRPR
jgi:RNA polymerase sigma-70 factor (ECF subfamily)